MLHRNLRELLQAELRRHRHLSHLPLDPDRLRIPDQTGNRQEMSISSSDPVHSGRRRNCNRLVSGSQRKTRT